MGIFVVVSNVSLGILIYTAEIRLTVKAAVLKVRSIDRGAVCLEGSLKGVS